MTDSDRDVESPEDAEFRRQVRAWIEAHKPRDPGFRLPQNFLTVETDQQFAFLRDWQRKVYDAGYLGLDWPAEYGGGGDPHKRQRIVGQEMSRAQAPFMVNTIGLQWAGPTILAHGTEEQKKRYLQPILSGEEIWCQGFSEPGAGSDLASLQARAEKQVDGSYRVSGHKVWTTLAQYSKWMILLARTDPKVNKYAGLSYFLFPMDAPGVTVEPLIKMNGEGGFNQVIFDESPMPADALLGEEGQGWQIAMTTLTFERGASEGTGGGQATGAAETVRQVVKLARRAKRDGRPAAEDPVLRDRTVQLWIREEGLRLAGQRARTPALNADRPGALRMMNKLVFSEFNRDLTALGCELLGSEATLWLGDREAPEDVAATAEPVDGGFVLRGRKTHVQAGEIAGLILAPFRETSGEVGLFAVELPTKGVSREQEIGVDGTRRTARVEFEGVRVGAEARLPGEGLPALRTTHVHGHAALAAEMVGAAESTLHLTRDYAIDRKQFDRQIGSFQGVKYPIVDMMVDVELSRTHALAAAAALDCGSQAAATHARMAKAVASDAFASAVAKAVQIHGGYGFTWDCDVHLYFKRALWSRATLGDAIHHRRHLADELFSSD